MIWRLLLLILFSLPTSAAEDNVVRLEGIAIQGNSEEPHVVYITPWRPPPGTGRLYQPIYSYREHWVKTIDRNSLGRELRYGERYLPKQVNSDRLQQLTGQAGQ